MESQSGQELERERERERLGARVSLSCRIAWRARRRLSPTHSGENAETLAHRIVVERPLPNTADPNGAGHQPVSAIPGEMFLGPGGSCIVPFLLQEAPPGLEGPSGPKGLLNPFLFQGNEIDFSEIHRGYTADSDTLPAPAWAKPLPGRSPRRWEGVGNGQESTMYRR